ncbi:MAG TPA: dihydrofolate reductase family protein [Baekduia sp.]|uniref:dihydrofolate reductase family protein n=1 Tax=Baekduia sp. TaxID=2600305 RepID=UPI002D7A1437|nr:dihydrofolate reductase family protein [Baekduia sp.]HET6505750.1 dihydrofolate reductase family protein [Baekduia sp.]
MSKVTGHVAVSIDGFVAGPDQSEEHPLGLGGPRLHEWHLPGREHHPVDEEAAKAILEGNGAYVMGRNMFGPIRGEWSGDWRGWWGPEPPYHAPVFVLTHHPREDVVMEGGTTFSFVTDGFDAALARAREAAGPDRNVSIAGGASTINQALAAGVLDELTLHVVPVVLGAGERLFVDVGDPRMEVVEATTSPGATHVRYRRV